MTASGAGHRHEATVRREAGRLQWAGCRGRPRQAEPPGGRSGYDDSIVLLSSPRHVASDEPKRKLPKVSETAAQFSGGITFKLLLSGAAGGRDSKTVTGRGHAQHSG